MPEQTRFNSPLLTRAEAADYLGIAIRTLDDWRLAGALPFIERGRYVRFMRDDLDEFLKDHLRPARKGRNRKCRLHARSENSREEKGQ